MAYGEENNGSDNQDFPEDLYKKWTKSGGVGRFLTIRSWLEAGKIAIDIGETNSDGLKASTLVYANALEVATYLSAVTNGTATNIYKNEEYVYYGGGQKDGKTVSRLLKIAYWSTKDNVDKTAFAWKTGHFEGTTSDTGAVIPNMQKPLSVSSIKVNRQEMAVITKALDLALFNHASHTPSKQWLKEINGKNRG